MNWWKKMIGDPVYGRCAFCGNALTAGHKCTPLFPGMVDQKLGRIDLPQLTEEDIRRIVREEIQRAFWNAHRINTNEQG